MFHVIRAIRPLPLVALGLMLCQRPTQAADILTPDLQALVIRARTAATAPYRNESSAERKQASDDFATAMDALGEQMTPDLARQCHLREGDDPDAKLALIAWDRHQHSELYQELASRYLYSNGNSGRIVQVSPPVLPKHATEEYRLAWEYLMLIPDVGYTELYDVRVANALQQIHNEASLTTYRLAFAISSDPNATKPDYSRNRQQLWLGSLSVFQDRAALHNNA